MASRKGNPISKKKLAYYLLEDLNDLGILETWKSRNINDTRYITKYISNMLERYLLFAGDQSKRHVLPVKGSVTQKFRREWLRTTQWGAEEKNRESYLNHAVDAVIAANLTKAYIEIGSDALRLRNIFYENKKRKSNAYDDYLEKCVAKMSRYYHFSEAYTRSLLKDPIKIPSYVPRLADEIHYRTMESDAAEFERNMQLLYGQEGKFLVPPHPPMTTFKQERKFSGTVCDDNPVKLVEIDGKMWKVSPIIISEISRANIDKLYTGDTRLIRQLRDILEEHEKVGDYLKANELSEFRDLGGQKIRKVSLLETSNSGYYKVEDRNGGYSYISGMKYYCVEIYRNASGQTKTYGIRFVDIVKKNGKLYQKRSSIPEDYRKHIMYLQKNDYIRVYDKKNGIKFEGFYKRVDHANRSCYVFQTGNMEKGDEKTITISATDTVVKYDVTILGHIGGQIKCSEPLQCIEEKK